MEKRKLSAIPRPIATPEMMEVADRLGGMRHIVTAELIDDKKILLLNFFEIQALKKEKTEAAFRTFLSHDDYITQDLKTSKTKWLTASFAGMYNFSLMDYVWNHQENKSSYRLNVFMRSDEELKIVKGFFKEYAVPDDEYSPWIEIHRFQQEVLDKRLAEKHKKETDKIDAVMNPIKEAPKEFFDWIWDTGMSFARYLIYKEVEKGKALCECTHCKEIGIVDRKNIRLRNNEKGICPFCGSRITIKASYKTNQGKTKGRNLDFMGFVFCGMEAFYRIYDGTKKRLKRVKVIVRDSIFLRGRRKFSKLIKKIKNRRTVSKHYAMSLLAYHGWIKNTDSFQFQSAVMWKEIIGIASDIVSRSEKGKPYTCDKYYQKWRTLYA